jgi:hypothetical protein
MNKNISEATPKDWKDFWENEDTVGDDIVVNMDGGVGGSWYTNNDLAKNWGSPIMGAPADY